MGSFKDILSELACQFTNEYDDPDRRTQWAHDEKSRHHLLYMFSHIYNVPFKRDILTKFP
jgi:hypothetical protein